MLERAERFHPADAEDDLLAHPHFQIAAVKFRGDQAILRRVLRRIGIEQVKIDAADLELPDFREDFALQNPHRDEQVSVAVAHFADREVMEILIQTDRFLHAFLIDLLLEVAVPIEQPDGDKFQIQIARRFAMIARENAETAGVIRD